MTPNLLRAAVAAFALAALTVACGDDDSPTSAPTQTAPTQTAPTESSPPSVRITSPPAGATVTSPVKVAMTAAGFEIEPAGPPRAGAGHFHVMVDVGCVAPGAPIPVGTAGYNHFGKAQAEAELELPAGEHKLCLQAGDGTHVALDLTDEISIVVAGA